MQKWVAASAHQFCEIAINNDSWKMRKLKFNVILKAKGQKPSKLQSSDLASHLFDSTHPMLCPISGYFGGHSQALYAEL